jgi:Undecaprenyl-phosphate glucose phosphotransferase
VLRAADLVPIRYRINPVPRVSVSRVGRWFSEPSAVGLLRAADCIAVLVAGILAYATRFSGSPSIQPPEIYALATGVLLVAHVFEFGGLYGTGRLVSVPGGIGRVMGAWTVVILVLIALGFITKTAEEFSRLWAVIWFLYSIVSLFIVRWLFRLQVRRWQRSGRFTRNIAVLGAGEIGRRFIEHLERTTDGSIRLLGLFDDQGNRGPDLAFGYPVLGGIDHLVRFCRENPVDQVVVALPWNAEERLVASVGKLKNLPVDVCLCPGVIGPVFASHGVTYLSGTPLLQMFERPLTGWSYMVKALEDRLIAALVLTLAAPLMLLIAIAIKLDSPGPVLFRQKRYGFNNQVIEVLKFRTMRVECAELGEGQVIQARRGDPRVTSIGRWLRPTSLDELPQLINVLRGEMSIVGPRPHAVAHNEHYAGLIDTYLARHRVKPGITGWAQVNGLRGETTTLDKMERRVQYDLHYIENWSLAFDLRILLRTFLVVFALKNAY